MNHLLQLLITVMLGGITTAVVAHPQHHHQHQKTQSIVTWKQDAQKNTTRPLDDQLRRQMIHVLLEKAYQQGDGAALEQAANLLQAKTSDLTTNDQLLSAKVAQANHQFNQAKQILQQIISKENKHPDALLQLANIYRLQGDFPQAIQYCQRLDALEYKLYRESCEFQVYSMQWPYEKLQTKSNALLQQLPHITKVDQQWIGQQLMEIATRFQNQRLADQVLPYLTAQHLPNAIVRSNWYLSQTQDQQVIDTLTPYRYHDGALFRIILSKKRLNQASTPTDLKELRMRMQQLRENGEHIHQREEAQFLWIDQQYSQGLQVAQENWQIQRETEDFEIYAELALVNKDVEAIQTLLDWSNRTGYQHPRYLPQLKASLK